MRNIQTLKANLSLSQLRLTRYLNDPTNQLVALPIFRSEFQQYILSLVLKEIEKALLSNSSGLKSSKAECLLELVFILVQKELYRTFPQTLPKIHKLSPETQWLIKRLCFLEGPLFSHLSNHLLTHQMTRVGSSLLGIIIDHIALKLSDLVAYVVLTQPNLNQEILRTPTPELVFLGEELSRLQLRLYWGSYVGIVISHPKHVYYSSHPILYVTDTTIKTRLIHYPRFSERNSLGGIQRFVVIYLEIFQLFQLQFSSLNPKRKSI